MILSFILYVLIAAVRNAAAMLFYQTAFREHNRLNIVRLELALRGLPPEFDGFRIVQVSDIHMGTRGRMTLARMRVIAGHICALQPDLIVVTGDFANRGIDPGKTQPLIQALCLLRAPNGVIGILGNHDYEDDVEVVRQAVCAGGVRLLVNEHIALKRGGLCLYIAGVDDMRVASPDLDAALDGIPEQAPVILLAHEPDYADTAALDSKVRLMLSGHTHGGQMRLPPIGALMLPKLGRKYEMGLYLIGRMALYVNRGVGTGFPHLRFNCQPEITEIVLRSNS